MIVADFRIVQWVESCRVIGLGVEHAVMHALVDALRTAGARSISADMAATSLNQPCHTLFEHAGFAANGSQWILAEDQTPEAVPFVAIHMETLFP